MPGDIMIAVFVGVLAFGAGLTSGRMSVLNDTEERALKRIIMRRVEKRIARLQKQAAIDVTSEIDLFVARLAPKEEEVDPRD